MDGADACDTFETHSDHARFAKARESILVQEVLVDFSMPFTVRIINHATNFIDAITIVVLITACCDMS